MKNERAFFLLLLSLVVMGCGNLKNENKAGENNTTQESEADDLSNAEEFLTELFSFNKDNRFSGVESFDEDTLENYYGIYRNMVTAECCDIMQKNRIPYKYDKLVAESYGYATVGEVHLEHYVDRTYDFSVEIEIVKGSISDIATFQGQLSVDDERKVASIFISKDTLPTVE